MRALLPHVEDLMRDAGRGARLAAIHEGGRAPGEVVARVRRAGGRGEAT